jgi:putative phage-type endonuclease
MITVEQREARKKYIGSSDVAAILGVDKYKSAFDIWLEKTGKLQGQEDNTNEAMEIGAMLEKAILHNAEKELGRMILNPDRLEFRHESLPIVSHPDGIVIKTNEPVDAKTSGILTSLADGWGEDGTDQVPEGVLIQTHVHMLCTKINSCHVPALLGGRGRAMFHVNASKDLLEIIAEKVDWFWRTSVQTDTPPSDSIPSLDVAKLIIREPAKMLPVRQADVEYWLKTKELKKMSEEEEEAAKATLLGQLLDAEASEPLPGLGQITYFEQSKPETIMKASTFRVLRIKKEKKGIVKT